MRGKWFGRKAPEPAERVPEIIGLRLGGAFELDPLRLRLLEPQLVVEGVAGTQLIEAVGVIRLDTASTVLRFYTDDEGYVEVLLEGGMAESHIGDVKLWYYYDTRAIGSDADWEQVLTREVSRPEVELEGLRFQRAWGGVSAESPPVAMTETTHRPGGERDDTDQFVMLYERAIDEHNREYCRYAAEEKIVNGQHDRCLVISTGFDLRPADIQIIG
jgi:hypothetical protein